MLLLGDANMAERHARRKSAWRETWPWRATTALSQASISPRTAARKASCACRSRHYPGRGRVFAAVAHQPTSPIDEGNPDRLHKVSAAEARHSRSLSWISRVYRSLV